MNTTVEFLNYTPGSHTQSVLGLFAVAAVTGTRAVQEHAQISMLYTF